MNKGNRKILLLAIAITAIAVTVFSFSMKKDTQSSGLPTEAVKIRGWDGTPGAYADRYDDKSLRNNHIRPLKQEKTSEPAEATTKKQDQTQTPAVPIRKWGDTRGAYVDRF